MNDNAKKWVAALRSGEYQQGRGSLRTPADRFCCLGVACDLYGHEHHIAWKGERFQHEEFHLPFDVQDWLGLNTVKGSYIAGNHQATNLANRNDNGANFQKIADIIESEPEGLFA